MNSPRRISLALLTLVSLQAIDVMAADWPRWRGPSGDGHATAGAAVPATLASEPKQVWKVRISDSVGSPVVAGGRVYFLDQAGEKEIAHALDAATGAEIWKQPVDDLFHDGQARGARSTPLVDGDRVYVTSVKGEFQCLKAADGALIWKKNFVQDFGAIFLGEISDPRAVGASRHGNVGAPILDGDHILVQAGGLDGASVVCLNKKTGDVVWKSQSDPSGYAGSFIATIAGVKQFIAFTANGVIGLGLNDGKLLWRFPIKTTWARHVTTPVVVDDIVMVSSHQHGLFGIKIARDGNGLTATQAWLSKDAAINFSHPVVVGQYLYGLGPSRNLICVDARTGQVAWSKDGFFTSDPGKAYAGFIVLGKNVLVLTDGGQIILFAADPKEFREIGRAQACGLNWCNPAYADGKLYLRDMKYLYCIALD